MLRYLIRRLFLNFLTLVGVSAIIFFIIYAVPGDPVTRMFGMESGIDPAIIDAAKKLYGLDKPVYMQYFIWINNILHLDLGMSIVTRVPVIELIAPRIIPTIILATGGMSLSLIFSIPFGIISASKHNTFIDLGITGTALFLISIPQFWVGIILILIFAVNLAILPTGGYIQPNVDFIGFLKTLVLPIVATGFFTLAQSTRMLRTTMLQVMRQDYIKLAFAYGINRKRIVSVHAFRNSLIPFVTVISMQLGYLLGGLIVIERVFVYPGLGMLLFVALGDRDYPLIQGIVILFSFSYIFINTLIDVIYGFINPKIKYQ